MDDAEQEPGQHQPQRYFRIDAGPAPPKRAPQKAEAKDAKGRVIARAERGRGAAVTIVVPKPDAVDGSELLVALMAVLEELSP